TRAIVVPITLDDGLVVARGAITTPDGKNLDGRFVVDTGVRATVIMFHPFVIERRLLQSQPHVLTGTIGGGAGGETVGDIGRLAKLRLGGMTFDRPTALFSRDTAGVFASPDLDGIIGGELLRRCKVTFDYPHSRLILEPYAGPAAEFEYDMSGLFLVARGEDFRALVVQSVSAGTPAAEAGLERGDQIVAIDGQGGASLALEHARELFRKPGAYRLDVARAGKRFSVRLVTRRLV
ncbi:MAG: PDZ domain-containing protein, partial [Candidatus Eisenbacteria bacterium]